MVKLQTLWKVYFWSATFVVAISAFSAVEIDSLGMFENLLDLTFLILTILGLCGLYGLAYGVALGVPMYWKWIFALSIGFDFVYHIYSVASFTQTRPSFSVGEVFVFLIGGLMLLIFYVGLYIYAFRSPTVWSTQLKPGKPASQ